jgi:hypothetical protein
MIEEYHLYFDTSEWWRWEVRFERNDLTKHKIFPRYHNPRCYVLGLSAKIRDRKVNWAESPVVLYELVKFIVCFINLDLVIRTGSTNTLFFE